MLCYARSRSAAVVFWTRRCEGLEWAVRNAASGRVLQVAGRRPFAGMKLLPEGRSLVGRGRTLTKTKASSGCRWHEKGTEIIYFFLFVCLYFDNLRRTLRGFRCCVFSGFVYSPARRENCAAESAVHAARSGALFVCIFDRRKTFVGLLCKKRPFLVSLADDTATARPKRRLMFSFTNGPARQPPFAFVLAAQP